jgi:hypothetical protein
MARRRVATRTSDPSRSNRVGCERNSKKRIIKLMILLPAGADRLFVSCVPPAWSHLWVHLNHNNSNGSQKDLIVLPSTTPQWKRAAIVGDLVSSVDELSVSEQRPHASASGDGAFLVTSGPRDRLAKVWKLPSWSRAVQDASSENESLPTL